MNEHAEKPQSDKTESYSPQRPYILYIAEEYQMEKIIETITYMDVIFEVVKRPESIFCGKLAYASDLDSEPDIGKLLDDYRGAVSIPKEERIAPDWDGAISIDYWKGGTSPRGMMFAQEVASENQNEIYDIYKMPASLFMRVFHDENAAKALGREKCPCEGKCEIWELFGLMKDIVMPKFGYRFNENGAQEFEYYNWSKYGTGFAYVPVVKE